MKAVKFTMTITTETLSVDSIPALLSELIVHIQNETACGELVKNDGDTVKWNLISKPVHI